VSDVLERTASTKDAVRATMLEAYNYAQMLAADGRRVHVVVKEWEEDKSIKQRGYYHGVVLTEISQQVRVQGERYTLAIWKEYFRAMFLGDKWELVTVPGVKRKKRRKVRVSSEDLGIKGYSKLIEQVTAHAATEWGVHFSMAKWEDYR
jgi:hypothetical protein